MESLHLQKRRNTKDRGTYVPCRLCHDLALRSMRIKVHSNWQKAREPDTLPLQLIVTIFDFGSFIFTLRKLCWPFSHATTCRDSTNCWTVVYEEIHALFKRMLRKICIRCSLVESDNFIVEISCDKFL